MTSDQFVGLPWQNKILENDFFNDSSSKTTIKAVLQTSLLLYEDSQ